MLMFDLNDRLHPLHAVLLFVPLLPAHTALWCSYLRAELEYRVGDLTVFLQVTRNFTLGAEVIVRCGRLFLFFLFFFLFFGH